MTFCCFVINFARNNEYCIVLFIGIHPLQNDFDRTFEQNSPHHGDSRYIVNPDGTPNTCNNVASNGNVPRQKIYRTAREEFFKDLMIDSSNSINNDTSYDDFKRAIENNDFDPSKYVPKVRVSGQPVELSCKELGQNQIFHGSLRTQTDQNLLKNPVRSNNQTFSGITDGSLQINVQSPPPPIRRFRADPEYIFHHDVMSYGSLKRRKEIKTANLSKLLR